MLFRCTDGVPRASGVPLCKRVLITGGAGYVGSALVPHLLSAGYEVTVLDLYLYGEDLFQDLRGPALREVKGDLRDPEVVQEAMKDVDAVIHLACISNDPSYDLDPALGRSINYDAFRPLVQAAKQAGRHGAVMNFRRCFPVVNELRDSA